jgi:L-iditol 2-dehydrogenase
MKMSMKALVKKARGKGQIELLDYPVPPVKEGYVLLRIAAAGICGSDLKIYNDDHPYFPPVILGHEFSGEIVEVGPGVKGWEKGERVVSEVHGLVCEHCRFCLSGEKHVCPSKRALGWGIDGGFAEYVAVPEWLLHRIPEGVSYEEAALLEPMAIAVHGILERAKVEPEDFVVVLGCGPLGLLAIQLAKSEGASRVFITGVNQDEKLRLRIAEKLGADRTINVEKEDPVVIVKEMTSGIGADLVVELSGSPGAISQGLRMVRTHGRFLAIGIPVEQEVSIPWKEIIFKAPSVIFHFSSCYSSWERSLSLLERKKVDVNCLISKILPLKDWEEGFRLAKSGEAIKVLLKP